MLEASFAMSTYVYVYTYLIRVCMDIVYMLQRLCYGAEQLNLLCQREIHLLQQLCCAAA